MGGLGNSEIKQENLQNAQASYGMFWRLAKRTARAGSRWLRRKAEGDEGDQLPVSAFLVSARVRLSPASPHLGLSSLSVRFLSICSVFALRAV